MEPNDGSGSLHDEVLRFAKQSGGQRKIRQPFIAEYPV
jgi:hypothetical protein